MFKGYDQYLEKMGLLKEFGSLSAELQDALLASIRIEIFYENEVILKPGSVCENLYLILEGATRNMTFSGGREITTRLAFEGQVAIVTGSFLQGIPSDEGIQTMEDTICGVLSYEAYSRFLNSSLEFNIFVNKVRSKIYLEMNDLLNTFRSKSTRERYEHYLEINALNISHVPEKYLASFLGMSRKTLGRLRKPAELPNEG